MTLVVNDSPNASLLVLDDADLGFRSKRELWPVSLTEPGSRPWVLVKMSCPVAQGDLWDYLCAQHAQPKPAPAHESNTAIRLPRAGAA